jgi:hypothetical protein
VCADTIEGHAAFIKDLDDHRAGNTQKISRLLGRQRCGPGATVTARPWVRASTTFNKTRWISSGAPLDHALRHRQGSSAEAGCPGRPPRELRRSRKHPQLLGLRLIGRRQIRLRIMASYGSSRKTPFLSSSDPRHPPESHPQPAGRPVASPSLACPSVVEPVAVGCRRLVWPPGQRIVVGSHIC